MFLQAITILSLALTTSATIAPGDFGSIPVDVAADCGTMHTPGLLRKCQGGVHERDSVAMDAKDLLGGENGQMQACLRQEDRMNCLRTTFLADTCLNNARIKEGLGKAIKENENNMKSICADGDVIADAKANLDAVNVCVKDRPMQKLRILRLFSNGGKVQPPPTAAPPPPPPSGRKRRALSTNLQTQKTTMAGMLSTLQTQKTAYDTALKAFEENKDASKTATLQANLDTAATTMKASLTNFKTAQAGIRTLAKTESQTLLDGVMSTQTANAAAATLAAPTVKRMRNGKEITVEGSARGLSPDQRRARQESRKLKARCKKLNKAFFGVCKVSKGVEKLGCANIDKVKNGLKAMLNMRVPPDCTLKHTNCPTKEDFAQSKERASVSVLGLVHTKDPDSNNVEMCREPITASLETFVDTRGIKVEIERADDLTAPAGFTGEQPQYVKKVVVTHTSDSGGVVDSMTFNQSSSAGGAAYESGKKELNQGDGKTATDAGLKRKVVAFDYSKNGTVKGTKIVDNNSGCFLIIYYDTEKSKKVFNVFGKCPKGALDQATGTGAYGCQSPGDPIEGVPAPVRRRRAAEEDANTDSANYDAQVCPNCSGVQSQDNMESDAESQDEAIAANADPSATTSVPTTAPPKGSAVGVRTGLATLLLSILAAYLI